MEFYPPFGFFRSNLLIDANQNCVLVFGPVYISLIRSVPSNYIIRMTYTISSIFIHLMPIRNLSLEPVLGQCSAIVIPARQIDIIIREGSPWQNIIAAF